MSNERFYGWPGRTLDCRWKLLRQIGTGAFGAVLLARDETNGGEVAVKLSANSNGDILRYEYEVLRYLHTHERKIGIPLPISIGTHGVVTAMTFDLLGKDLGKLKQEHGGRLSLPSVYRLGIMVIKTLESIHDRSYVHRDIKPDNLLIGRDDPSQLYVIDFGFAKLYRDATTFEHYEPRRGESQFGPIEYWSTWTHRWLEKTRRDDLVMAGYSLVHLFKGSLPWSGMNRSSQRRLEAAVLKKKERTSTAELCAGMGSGFEHYFDYVLGLNFVGEPDYSYLRRVLRRTVKENGWKNHQFEWDNGSNDGYAQGTSGPALGHACAQCGGNHD